MSRANTPNTIKKLMKSGDRTQQALAITLVLTLEIMVALAELYLFFHNLKLENWPKATLNGIIFLVILTFIIENLRWLRKR